MIEWILYFILAMTAIIIMQSTYNSLLYRHKKSALKVILVVIIDGVTLVLSLATAYGISRLEHLQKVGLIIRIINVPFASFFNYLPKWALFIWFVLPLLIAWVFFLFKGGIVYQAIKRKFIEFNKNQALAKKETKEHKNKVQNSQTKPKLETQSIPSNAKKMPPKMHFLDDVQLHHLEPKTFAGVKKMAMMAKNGLIVGKTKNGYVACYRTGQGYKDLKKLFSKNSIDISMLKPQSSIVFFNHDKVKAQSFKNYIRKMKEGAL